MKKIQDKGKRLFSNRDLIFLFVPLVIEQLLEYLVGLADSIMVAHIGEAAVSGVSLVDMIMVLLLSLFAAIATGGAVVAGQYLGKGDRAAAGTAMNTLLRFAILVSLVIMGLMYLFSDQILLGLFGQIAPEVYAHARTYLLFVVASIPFMAIYGVGASLFRTVGNARLPMMIMLLMNLLNVIGNAVMIYVLDFGIIGIAIPTLISRIGAAVIIMFFALNQSNELHFAKGLRGGFKRAMIPRILHIAVPYGFENGLFHLGRVLVLSLISTFGTAAIAANAVSVTLINFQVLPGMSIGLGMTVVIARCVGAGDEEQARYYTRKVLGIVYAAQLLSAAGVLALLPSVMTVYSLSPEATLLANRIIWSHAIAMLLIWPLGYTLPVTFRAAGDARFPMLVSTSTMLFLRLGLAYGLSVYLGLGVIGTWLAIYIDWIVKSVLFVRRYRSGRWLLHRLS